MFPLPKQPSSEPDSGCHGNDLRCYAWADTAVPQDLRAGAYLRLVAEKTHEYRVHIRHHSFIAAASCDNAKQLQIHMCMWSGYANIILTCGFVTVDPSKHDHV